VGMPTIMHSMLAKAIAKLATHKSVFAIIIYYYYIIILLLSNYNYLIIITRYYNY
jgi:hypothetical protein